MAFLLATTKNMPPTFSNTRRSMNVAKKLTKIFKKAGVTVLSDTGVTEVNTKRKVIKVTVKSNKEGKQDVLDCHILLSAAG